MQTERLVVMWWAGLQDLVDGKGEKGWNENGTVRVKQGEGLRWRDEGGGEMEGQMDCNMVSIFLDLDG